MKYDVFIFGHTAKKKEHVDELVQKVGNQLNISLADAARYLNAANNSADGAFAIATDLELNQARNIIKEFNRAKANAHYMESTTDVGRKERFDLFLSGAPVNDDDELIEEKCEELNAILCEYTELNEDEAQEAIENALDEEPKILAIVTIQEAIDLKKKILSLGGDAYIEYAEDYDEDENEDEDEVGEIDVNEYEDAPAVVSVPEPEVVAVPTPPTPAPQAAVPPVPPVTSAPQPSYKQKMAEIEALANQYLTDGLLSDKERQVLRNKAFSMGLNVDEVDLVLDAMQQKADMEVNEAAMKKRGKTCPYCNASIPMFADRCPACKGEVTPEASKEIKDIIQRLEYSLTRLKTGYGSDLTRAKADIAQYSRKARLYYGNNPKVKLLLEEIEREQKEAEKGKTMRTIKAWMEDHPDATKGIIFVAVAITLILSLVLYISSGEEDHRETVAHVTTLVNNGDLDEARDILQDLEFEGGTVDYLQNYDDMYLKVIRAYVNIGEYDEAESLALSFRSKLNDMDMWHESSCYSYLKREFRDAGIDFSALEGESSSGWFW